MILVDTSVWIEAFRRNGNLRIEDVVSFDEIVCCLPIVQEVLQGFREERDYRRAREAMLSLPIVDAPVGIEAYQGAIDLYRLARRAGLTVRSSVDCLIASSALRHDLLVLHRDRDFGALARISALRERSV